MILFRADASQEMGFGRLTRATYLSSLLKKKSRFLFCIKKDKAASKFLQSKGIPFCLHRELERLDLRDFEALVFDVANFENEESRVLEQATALRIPTIQFLGPNQGPRPVDHVIAPSMEPVVPGDYCGTFLSGAQFSLLHHKFRHFNKIERKYRKRVKYIFLALGSSVDYRNLRDIIDILTRNGFPLKIAPGFFLKNSVAKILKRIYPKIRFVGQPESLARSFYEADLALVTPGTLAFEAAAVGTPALYFYNNQISKALAGVFESKGLGLSLSPFAPVSESLLLNKITNLTQEKRIIMGARGKEHVDGLGAYRVMDFLSSVLFNPSDR